MWSRRYSVRLLILRVLFQFTAQRLQDSHINQPSTSTLSSDPHSHPHSHSSHSALYFHGGSNTTSATSASSLTGGGISSAAVSAAAAAAVAAAAPQQQSSLVGPGGTHSSAGSVSSTGGISPTSPHRGKEEDCSLHGRSSTEGWYLSQ